jgi:squalene cyclase
MPQTPPTSTTHRMVSIIGKAIGAKERAPRCGWLLVLLAMGIAACKPSRSARVDAAIESGSQFLRSLQSPDGAIRDSVNPLFDIWETVEAATALQAAGLGSNSDCIQKAVGFLRSQENTSGLLCHNRACRSATCIETSTEYLLLRKTQGELRELGSRFDSLRLLQQTDGSWLVGNPDVREAKDFPSVSGFALSLLQWQAQSNQADPPFKASSATVEWLLDQQSEAGDWGSAWEYYGSPGYALWPILRALHSLPEQGNNGTQVAIAKARDFIRATQSADGSWHHSLPPSPQQHGPTSIKRTSPALQSALMLAAYLETNPAIDDPSLLSGIDFLLASQTPEGAWDGGFFPIPHRRYEKREYIFASSMALRVLASFAALQPAQP